MIDKGEFGAWSTSGCKEVLQKGNERICSCTQLAHFGILFVNIWLCAQLDYNMTGLRP